MASSAFRVRYIVFLALRYFLDEIRLVIEHTHDAFLLQTNHRSFYVT